MRVSFYFSNACSDFLPRIGLARQASALSRSSPRRRSSTPLTQPGENIFFLGDLPHGLDLAVHDHRRRAEDAVSGDLSDIADLLDVGCDTRLGGGLPNQFFHLLAIDAAWSQNLDFHRFISF